MAFVGLQHDSLGGNLGFCTKKDFTAIMSSFKGVRIKNEFYYVHIC